MKTVIRVLAVLLLLFLGFGGLYGAWMLVSDPSGGKFDWSLSLLDGTPFTSFLVPGIILALSNGIFPLYVAISLILKARSSGSLLLLQGGITIGWLTAQLIFNPDFFVPEMHYPSYAVGILLACIGLILVGPGAKKMKVLSRFPRKMRDKMLYNAIHK